MVKLLELFFGEVGELVDAFDVAGIELFFVMENDVIVGLVEDEFSVSLLQRTVFLCIFLHVIRVGFWSFTLRYKRADEGEYRKEGKEKEGSVD